MPLVLAIFELQVERFTDHPWVYIAMPFIAAIIGYTTKLAAIRMMFDPIEFVGVGKLGWQGIVPRRAAKMAAISVETMTRELVSVRDIVAKLDGHRLAKEIEAPLLRSVEDVTREVLQEFQPGLWESLPEAARRLVINRVKAEAPNVVAGILKDVQDDIENVFDLRHMVVTNLLKDKVLLNRMFREVGAKEFRFIANSGIYFGFTIGLVQAVTYLFIEEPWVLPAFGLFVGYSTDWLALKMLFNPKQPKRILGVTFQGLFLKRQQEVARDYGRMIADEILTPANFFEALVMGPASDRLFRMVYNHVQEVIDSQAGLARPLVVFAIGSKQYQGMKTRIAERLLAELPETLVHAEQYTADAMDVRGTVVEKMLQLTPVQFEGILRPAFQADEWILITVGAVLGFLVGLTQDVLLVPLFKGELF